MATFGATSPQLRSAVGRNLRINLVLASNADHSVGPFNRKCHRGHMNIDEAQRGISRAYVGGAPGVLVSGLVWLVAGLVWSRAGAADAFHALFVGGMAIFPVSTLVARFALRAPAVDPANPLNRLGLESTFVLLAGVLVGYVMLRVKPELAIPTVSVVMGARYFAFRTVYGQVLYWALAGAICLVGTLAVFGRLLPVGNLAVQVAVIEVGLGLVLLWRYYAAR